MTPPRLVAALATVAAVVGLGAVSVRQGAATATAVVLLRTPDGGIQPQIAVDAAGALSLLFFKGDPAHGDLYDVRLDGRFNVSPAIRVNSDPGTAIATGSIRGGQIAIGRGGRVHVAWPGSAPATPRGPGGTAPIFYARLNDARTNFEPERNLARVGLNPDGGSIAADARGDVYVAWHAEIPGGKDESARRLWVARSTDDGRTFGAESAVSDPRAGACGCCGVKAIAGRDDTLYILFRSAADLVHRDSDVLMSHDRGVTFASNRADAWDIGACPMSTYALADSADGAIAAWEHDGQVAWADVDDVDGRMSPARVPPGAAGTRKHPAVVRNAQGDTLLAWTEGTSWNRGGAVAWQVFDSSGRATADHGLVQGVPTWGLVSAAATQDGRFVVVY